MEDTAYLEQLIANYQPSAQAVNVVNNTTIILIAGVAGAGKDTIKQELLKMGRFHHLVSHTTRAPRLNNGQMEVDGQDYYFISLAQAIEMLEQQQFIEAKFVHGRVYGTSLAEIEQAITNDKLPLTDIDVQGVAEYCAMSQRVVPLFIMPPSYDEWLARIRGRYSDQAEFEAEWAKRSQTAIWELQEVVNNSHYYCLINDNFRDTAAQALALIDGQTEVADQARARQLAQEFLHKLQA